MKTIFYGSAIQGAVNRKERAEVNKALINFIKSSGFEVVSEHTGGSSIAETARLLNHSFGVIPTDPTVRRRFIRDKLIGAVEDPATRCCIFEVSTPSIGTGIELSHAYLRPRLGLLTVPVLALYQKGYWSNELSTMVRGISSEEVPHFILREYMDTEEAKAHISALLRTL